MNTRSYFFIVLAFFIGIALVAGFSKSVLAQDQPPTKPGEATPAEQNSKGPAPTPDPLDKSGGNREKPAAVEAVDYSTSYLTGRGAHPNENAAFILVIANTGANTGANTEAQISLPKNAAYVNGSAQVQGGGTLLASAELIQWTGTIANGASVRIIFRAILPATIGEAVSVSAAIFDPGLPAAINLATSLKIQAPTGGPDPFGYTYKDNLAPASSVSYDWVFNTIAATKLNFGALPADDAVSPLTPIGFSFRFYRNSYTDMYINTNGLVMFGAGNSANATNTPKAIPTPGSPDNYLSCFASDLYLLDTSQGVWVETFGSAPNRYTAITFRAAYFSFENVAPAQFQVVLFESSNKVKCQYQATADTLPGSGGWSQIGMENDDGTAGLSYYFNAAMPATAIGPLNEGLAIEFTPGAAALPVYNTSKILASANVHPGDTAKYTLVVRNTGTGAGSSTTVVDPIPVGASYVGGSAAVLGGGSLIASSATVNWSGSIAAGSGVTITYQVVVPTVLGSVLTNTATINDGLASAPFIMNNSQIRVLPPPTGGPDYFGYTYKDSYDPSVSFTWVPTSATSTKVNFGAVPADDVMAGPFPIGFSFSFYQNAFSDFYVSSNGLVSFGAGYSENINRPIPRAGDSPKNFAACHWGDLYIKDAAQGVWYETGGPAGSKYLAVTFKTIFFESNSNPAIMPTTFQMILYEGSNQIKCQYLDAGGSVLGSGGGGATIGLENADETSGLQYFFQDAGKPDILGPIENNLAVLFFPSANVPAFSASVKRVTPSMHPGNVLEYTVGIVNNSGTTGGSVALSDPIPAGSSFVPGSLGAIGGGVAGYNNGSSTVNWSGSILPTHRITVTFQAVLGASSGLITNTASINDPAAALPTVRQAVTPVQPPSGFGSGTPRYYYHDSYTPGTSYSLISPSGSAAIMSVTNGDNDDGYGTIPLGFDFKFFGRSYSSVKVSTNGLVMFNDVGSTDWDNKPIGTPGGVDNYATCLWDDQQAANLLQGVAYELKGSAPNYFMVIWFYLQNLDPSTSGPSSYQMVLYQTSNAIKCQYINMSGSAASDGRSATIGLEGPFGASGIQYFSERKTAPFIGPLHSGLAVEFVPAPEIFLPLALK